MASTQWTYHMTSGLLLLGSTALVACVSSAASGPVPATAVSGATDDEDAVADLNEHDRHHHQGGVTMFIALSLDSLGLSPEQQGAVTKIQSDLFEGMEPARAAEQTVLVALAEGVAAGAIDQAKVDAAITELGKASGRAHEATADALNRLHAQLTPPQRGALVDKILAHWAVFRRANAADEQVGKEGPDTGPLPRLGKDLGLTADQVNTIAMRLGTSTSADSGTVDPWRIDAHLHRLDAFRADTFDAKALSEGAAANANVAAQGATRMARFYGAVALVLTPEQRAKLAQALREHASHKDAASLHPDAVRTP